MFYNEKKFYIEQQILYWTNILYWKNTLNQNKMLHETEVSNFRKVLGWKKWEAVLWLVYQCLILLFIIINKVMNMLVNITKYIFQPA